MLDQNISSVISVIPVKSFEESLTWYTQLIGREPDVVPVEGVAEWQIAGQAWIQVALDPERSGGTTLVICVNDLEKQYKACLASDFLIGEIQEYPEVIKMAELQDLEGNKIAFVQDISVTSTC